MMLARWVLPIVLVAAAAAPALAYPITPHPLRKLAAGAAWIVTGKVARIGTTADDDPWRGGSIATLEIDSELKGARGARTVEVRFAPNVICPADARYKEGEEVLAFLSEHEGQWYTFGRDYGKKTIGETAARESYVARTREILDLLAAPDDGGRRAKTLEWLVTCAEGPHTRWEGAYELFRKGDFMSGYDDSAEAASIQELSEAQRERLIAGLVRAPALASPGSRCLLAYAVERKEARLIPVLRAALAEAKEDPKYFTEELMKALAALREWPRGTEIANEYPSSYQRKEVYLAVLLKFIEEYDALPAPAPENR